MRETEEGKRKAKTQDTRTSQALRDRALQPSLVRPVDGAILGYVMSN